MALLSLAVAVFGFMLLEARRAARNERAQRARGGIEPPDDLFTVMQITYPAAFLAMLVEGAARGTVSWASFTLGAALFVAAKTLKWWAILTLGPFWTFRVLVVPGAARIRRGPYRVLSHPNYIGVVGELAGVGLMTGAWITGPLGTAIFGALILRRVAVENRALRVLTDGEW